MWGEILKDGVRPATRRCERQKKTEIKEELTVTTETTAMTNTQWHRRRRRQQRPRATTEVTALNKTLPNCQRETTSTWIWNAGCFLLFAFSSVHLTKWINPINNLKWTKWIIRKKKNKTTMRQRRVGRRRRHRIGRQRRRHREGKERWYEWVIIWIQLEEEEEEIEKNRMISRWRRGWCWRWRRRQYGVCFLLKRQILSSIYTWYDDITAITLLQRTIDRRRCMTRRKK